MILAVTFSWHNVNIETEIALHQQASICAIGFDISQEGKKPSADHLYNEDMQEHIEQLQDASKQQLIIL